jgi:hypothetical protein
MVSFASEINRGRESVRNEVNEHFSSFPPLRQLRPDQAMNSPSRRTSALIPLLNERGAELRVGLYVSCIR